MKRLRDESGQTIVFVALSMSVLLGFAAFATDIGVMLRERNRAQIAADSAAIAGAKNLHYGSAAIQAAAKHDAALNGFTDGVDGVTVTVSDPPAAGEVGNPLFAQSGFVKVMIAKDTPGFFMKLFNRSSMAIAASAVATNKAQSENCFYVTNPSAPEAMNLQGSFKINAPGCGIIVESNSGDALQFTGKGGTLTASSVEVVGGASGQTADSHPAPIMGVAAIGDPLSWEKPVDYDPGSCTSVSTLTGVIGPSSFGTVCYSPSSSKGTINLNNVTLNPGVYVFTGPVSLSGNVTAVGATLYLANGGLTANTNSTLNLVAPQGAQYDTNGLVIYEARGNTGTIEFEKGNATGSVTGIIYAPNAQLFIHDSGGDSSGGTSTTAALDFNIDLDVDTFYDKTGSLTLTSYSQTIGAGTSPLTKVTLVE